MSYRSIHQRHMPGLLLVLNTSANTIVSVRLFQAPVGSQSLSFSWHRPRSPRTSACGRITLFISTREKCGRGWAGREHFSCYKTWKAQVTSPKQTRAATRQPAVSTAILYTFCKLKRWQEEFRSPRERKQAHFRHCDWAWEKPCDQMSKIMGGERTLSWATVLVQTRHIR